MVLQTQPVFIISIKYLNKTLSQSGTEIVKGGEKEKVLILTHFPAIQAIIWLWLSIYH